MLQTVQRFLFACCNQCSSSHLTPLLAAGGDGGGELDYSQLCEGSIFKTRSKDGSWARALRAL